MNITGRYSDIGLDLEGVTDALHDLSRAIQAPREIEEFSLKVPSTSPAPYLGFISSLKIEMGVGKVCISRSEDRVVIAGSPEMLAVLAHNIERLAEQMREPTSSNSTEHIHIEYHPGHFYLSDKSEPMVVTKST